MPPRRQLDLFGQRGVRFQSRPRLEIQIRQHPRIRADTRAHFEHVPMHIRSDPAPPIAFPVARFLENRKLAADVYEVRCRAHRVLTRSSIATVSVCSVVLPITKYG